MRISPFSPALVAIWMAFLVCTEANAQQTDPISEPNQAVGIDYTALDDEALIARFQAYAADPNAPVCDVRSLLSEMLERQALKDVITPIFNVVSVECAVAKRDWKTAYQYAQLWEQTDSEEKPDPVYLSSLAYLSGELDDALTRLERIAQSDQPDLLLGYSDRHVSEFASKIQSDGKEEDEARFYNAFVQSPHFNSLTPNVKSVAAAHMIGVRMSKGDQGGAVDLIHHVTTPYLYLRLLSDKQFEAIWPNIERNAGDNMELLTQQYVKSRRDAYQADTNNKELKSAYGEALVFAGEFEGAIKLAGTIDHSLTGVSGWQQDDAWLLNSEANAHDALGNNAAAEKIFDDLLSLYDPDGRRSWPINFVINRALRMVHQGRWEEGLLAAENATDFVQRAGNPFANMLIRKAKVCALSNLARYQEAKAILQEVKVHKADSLVVAIEAHLCAKENETAAEFLVEGLKDKGERAELVESLQNRLFNPFYQPIALPSIHRVLRNHPDVVKEFDKIARFIPDRLIPVGNLRRVELAANRQAN